MTPDKAARPVIRMTYRQSRKVNTLIHRLCANCFEGNCLLLDDGETTVCPQTLTYSLLCTYFKAAVLPADPALYTELMERGNKKKCVLCGTDFYPAYTNTRYCPRCGKAQARRKAAERQRRKRANVTLSAARNPDV